eukprot:scaffold8374_cov175-Amphora_coffeaeformis.AAC.9
MIQVIAAGVLLLPAALVMIITAPVVALLSLPAAALLTFRKQKKKKTTSEEGYRRAIVTGGSSGIGLAVAQECVEKGFDQVVIIARNMDKLKAAKDTLEKVKSKSGTIILPLSVDVSSLKKLEDAAKEIFAKGVEESSTYLFCCAGQATPHRFLDLTEEVIMHNTKTNQLGTMFTVRAMLPHMKAGTMAGQVGVYGLGAYAPSKFALVGLAQVLHMELCDSPINVCCAYPPDTDTPGFQEENLTKPAETHLISEAGGLAKPGDVGRKMVQSATQANPPFAIYFNFDAWMLSNLTAGMGPTSVVGDVVAQIAAMGLFRVISLFYLNAWWSMLRTFHAKKDVEKKKDYGATRKETVETEKSE